MLLTQSMRLSSSRSKLRTNQNARMSWHYYIMHIKCLDTCIHGQFRQCAVVIIIIWFQGPQQYVDELLEIHRKFSTLIKDTFRDDPAFISALDKVTHYYIIYEIRTLTLKYEDLTNWFDNVRYIVMSFSFLVLYKETPRSIDWIIMLN